MNSTRLRQSANHTHWVIDGDLDFASVPLVWREMRPLITPGGQVKISLDRVKHSNSAALALLLQGKDLARTVGCELSYVRLPERLVALAEMSNITAALDLDRMPPEDS